MCGIDWTALGTWAGAAAVSLGVGVAFFQLRSLNANERVRTTVEFLNGWTKDETRSPSGEIITPSSGANSMIAIRSMPERAAQYREDVEEYFNGTLRRDRGDAYADAIGVKTAGVWSVANYFIKAESLIRRNRLDEDLFLEQMANQMTAFWGFVNALRMLMSTQRAPPTTAFSGRSLSARQRGIRNDLASYLITKPGAF